MFLTRSLELDYYNWQLSTNTTISTSQNRFIRNLGKFVNAKRKNN